MAENIKLVFIYCVTFTLRIYEYLREHKTKNNMREC